MNLGTLVNSPAYEISPSISTDGLELYFSDYKPELTRPGGHGWSDIWVTTRPTRHAPWGEAVNLGPVVNSSTQDTRPHLSPDGLSLFFDSQRDGRPPYGELYMTTRTTLSEPWGAPVNVGPIVNSPEFEESPCISSDGTTLFFDRGTIYANTYDIWQAPIIPIVDFNGDGIVDAQDMCVMVDHWGENHSLCDIGPMPWGDGVVDVEDLKVLAENLFEEVNDPTLVAHWALDETEGGVAQESVGDSDAYAMGGLLWRPAEGVVDGAAELDGVDDYIITGSVLNPAEGPFSVLAWIKGGAPGQGIVAQQVIGDWLTLGPDGGLLTELKDADGLAVPLISETIITDGQWHRVGLVWDGSRRTLCVDGVAVAEDVQTGVEDSDRGLYIGVGTDFAPDSFFCGLIDDVRIYNRAVKP